MTSDWEIKIYAGNTNRDLSIHFDFSCFHQAFHEPRMNLVCMWTIKHEQSHLDLFPQFTHSGSHRNSCTRESTLHSVCTRHPSHCFCCRHHHHYTEPQTQWTSVILISNWILMSCQLHRVTSQCDPLLIANKQPKNWWVRKWTTCEMLIQVTHDDTEQHSHVFLSKSLVIMDKTSHTYSI